MDSPSKQSYHSLECIIDDNSFFDNDLEIPDIQSKNSDFEFHTTKKICKPNSAVDEGDVINKKCNSNSLCDAEYMINSNNNLFTQEFTQISGKKKVKKNYFKEISLLI